MAAHRDTGSERPLLAALRHAPELLDELSDWLVLTDARFEGVDHNAAAAEATGGDPVALLRRDPARAAPCIATISADEATKRLARGQRVDCSAWAVLEHDPIHLRILSVPVAGDAGSGADGRRTLSLVRPTVPRAGMGRDAMLSALAREVAGAMGGLVNAIELATDEGAAPPRGAAGARLLATASATARQLRRALGWLRDGDGTPEPVEEVPPMPLSVLGVFLERWLAERGWWSRVEVDSPPLSASAPPSEGLPALPATTVLGVVVHMARGIRRWSPRADWLRVSVTASVDVSELVRIRFELPEVDGEDADDESLAEEVAMVRSVVYTVGGFDTMTATETGGFAGQTHRIWEVVLPCDRWPRSRDT